MGSRADWATWALELGLALLLSACSSTGDHDRVAGEACGCNGDCLASLYCSDSVGHDIRAEDVAIGSTCDGHGTCAARRPAGASCDSRTPCATGVSSQDHAATWRHFSQDDAASRYAA